MDTERDKEVLKLREMLKEIEGNLHLSAKHGMQLLDENVKLKHDLNKNTTSNEVLEQERHNLRRKLDASIKSEEALKEELDFARDQMTTDKRDREKTSTDNSRLSQTIKELKSALSEKEEIEAELRSVIDKLETKLKETTKSDESECNTSKTYSDELVNDLQKEIDECKQREITLMQLLDEKETKLEESQRSATKERNKVELLETELEAKECQLTSYGNVLERCREEISDLQAEMKILSMEDVDPNRRGNSLFSEVEDHRQRLEKHLNSLRTKYNSLYKENEENLQRIGTLQLKLAASSAAVGSGSNVVYVEHLERQVAKFQAEIRVLVAKQEKKVKVQSFDFGADKDDKYGYLKAMITQAQSHGEELETECKSLQLKCMSEGEQSRKVRRQLFDTEQRADALRAENLRLKVKLDELQRKCGIEREVKNQVRKVVEKVPIMDENDDDIKTNRVESIKLEEGTEQKDCQQVVRFSSDVGKVTSWEETNSFTELQSKKLSTKRPVKMVTVTKQENECKQQ